MTIPACTLHSECLSIIDENKVPKHNHSHNQAECHIEPSQADTVAPWLKSEDKHGRNEIANDSDTNDRVRNDLINCMSVAQSSNSKRNIQHKTYISV